MTSLRTRITDLFRDAFQAAGLDSSNVTVEVSQRPELGQFQCNGALPAAKIRQENPRVVAQSIIDAVPEREIFADLSIAGPGFINMTLTDRFLGAWIARVADDERLGVATVDTPTRIVMDYGGQNIAKSMHVGHLRSSIIGDCLHRLIAFLGDDVTSDIHLGDWGLQMGQLITELQRRQPGLSYFDEKNNGPWPEESPVTIDDLEEMYPVASALTQVREDDDPEAQERARAARDEARAATAELQRGRPGYVALWRHFRTVSIAALKRDLGALGVDFDLWYGESDAQPLIPAMIEHLRTGGFVEESEGAQVIFLPPDEGEKDLPPLILVNRDGGVGYGTTDLATIVQRVRDFDPDEIIYVVDARQGNHFEQVFRAARRTGIAGRARLEHLGFGTMNGPDGRPFKTRAGGVLKLNDLIEMAAAQAMARMTETGVAEEYDEVERSEIARLVGIATIKYADLANHRTSNYIFDLEKFTSFEGRTGAYLLYTTVRCTSILRKGAERGFAPGAILDPTERERDLVLALAALPEALYLAYDKRAPNYLCEFLFTLAQEFSRFYANCHILTETNSEQRASWLALVRLVLRQLELGLGLLGISAPQRM